jgi:hypothetical protein
MPLAGNDGPIAFNEKAVITKGIRFCGGHLLTGLDVIEVEAVALDRREPVAMWYWGACMVAVLLAKRIHA